MFSASIIPQTLTKIPRRCSPVVSHHLEAQIDAESADWEKQEKADASDNFVDYQKQDQPANRKQQDAVIQNQAYHKHNNHYVNSHCQLDRLLIVKSVSGVKSRSLFLTNNGYADINQNNDLE